MDATALTMLLGAGLVVVPSTVAWLLGRASGRRHADRPTTSTLLCSCGHGYGTHADERRCHGSDTRRRNGLQEVDPCPCRLYDGPEPLPRAWSPALPIDAGPAAGA